MHLHRRPDEPEALASESDFADSLARVLALLAPAIVLMSLAAHLIAIEWIYDVHFMMIFASPLFLGLACVCLRMDTSRTRFTRAETETGATTPSSLAFMAAVFAVLLALGDAPRGAIWDGGGWSWIGLSPLRVVLISAATVFSEIWRLRRRKVAFVLGIATSFAAFLGHTPTIIGQHFGDLFTSTIRLLGRFWPLSREGWGMFLFTLAFVLLGAGALLSSWKTRDSK